MKVTIALVYRSPNSSNKNNKNLNETLTHLTNLLKLPNLIIIGDFNYKTKLKFMSLKCDFETPEGKFSKCLMDNFFIQHVDEDTRVREGQVSSLLDLVTNTEYMFSFGKSDHLLLRIETVFEIGECVKKQHYQIIIKPRLNAGDYTAIRSNIRKINWEENFKDKNLEEMWLFFKSTINDQVKDHIPYEKRERNQQ